MKKVVFKFFIIIGIIILLLILLLVGCVMIADHRNKNYWKYADPKGEIEKKFTSMGDFNVAFKEFSAADCVWKKYEIWYPADMKKGEKYPLVIMVNGTGVKASQYKEVFKHLASWGFIVAGNEDDNSRTGESSAATLDFLLSLNNDENSKFYGMIDVENIGIAGHSQGGVGAVNAVTMQKNGSMYKAVFTASTTSPALSEVLGDDWKHDMTKINIPCFMVAGTGIGDAGKNNDKNASEGQGICPLWSLNESFDNVRNTAVTGRLKNKDHGDMLRYADGYMTAWFMYYLKGDSDSRKAFFGKNAEISDNDNWQDVNIRE